MKAGLAIVSLGFSAVVLYTAWTGLSGSKFLVWIFCSAMAHIFAAAYRQAAGQ